MPLPAAYASSLPASNPGDWYGVDEEDDRSVAASSGERPDDPTSWSDGMTVVPEGEDAYPLSAMDDAQPSASAAGALFGDDPGDAPGIVIGEEWGTDADRVKEYKAGFAQGFEDGSTGHAGYVGAGATSYWRDGYWAGYVEGQKVKKAKTGSALPDKGKNPSNPGAFGGASASGGGGSAAKPAEEASGGSTMGLVLGGLAALGLVGVAVFAGRKKGRR